MSLLSIHSAVNCDELAGIASPIPRVNLDLADAILFGANDEAQYLQFSAKISVLG